MPRRRPYQHTEYGYNRQTGRRFVSAIVTRGPQSERVGCSWRRERVVRQPPPDLHRPLPRDMWPLESRIQKPRYRRAEKAEVINDQAMSKARDACLELAKVLADDSHEGVVALPNPFRVIALVNKAASNIARGLGKEEYANKWLVWSNRLQSAIDENRCRPSNILRPYLKLAPQTNEMAWHRRRIVNKAFQCNEAKVIWLTFFGKKGEWKKESSSNKPERIVTTKEHKTFLKLRPENDNFNQLVKRRQDLC